jgi:hypothetical protein
MVCALIFTLCYVVTDYAENCTERGGVVECLIGFVAETMLQSIKRATDDQIAQWYYDVSLSLVACRW